jgi:hypothetical protein
MNKPNMNTAINKINPGKNKMLRTSFGFDDGLRMFYSIKVNGEDKGRYKSDSFVQFFPRTLHKWLTGSYPYMTNNSDGYFFGLRVTDVYEEGGNVVVDGTRLEEGSTSTVFTSRIEHVFLDIRSIPHLAGHYQERNVGFGVASSSNNWSIKIILYGKSLEGLVYDPDQVGTMMLMDCNTSISGSDFHRPLIHVGTNNNPVHMDDLFLVDKIYDGSEPGQMVHGSMTEDPVHVEQEWTRCRMKRTFTNQTDSDITVREIGINAGRTSISEGNWNRSFIVRDVTADILVPPQGNLEVVYDIETVTQNVNYNTDADGTNKGILTPFIQLLVSTFQSASLHQSYFLQGLGGSGCLNSSGRGRDYYREDGSLSSENTGIILGTDNQYVSQTNESLFGRITHGEGDGQLFHFGHYLMPIERDLVNQVYTIRFGRMFKNSGAIPITIKELGIVLSRTQTDYKLMARAAYEPADQVTVDPGEYIQVEVTLNFPV